MSQVKFLVLADSHHTDQTGQDLVYRYSGQRLHSISLTNVAAIATAADAIPGLSFIIHLGDDNSVTGTGSNLKGYDVAPGGAEGYEKRNLEYLSEFRAAIDAAAVPVYDVIGNWTFGGISDTNNGNGTDAITKYLTQFTRPTTVNSGAGGRYYSFNIGNSFHGVVLDSTELAADDTWKIWDDDMNGSPNYAIGSSSSNKHINTTQQDWLAADLATYRGRMVVVFCHHLLSQEAQNLTSMSYHDCEDAEAVRTILEAENDAGGDVIAVISGHHHPGTQAWWGWRSIGEYADTYQFDAAVLTDNKDEGIHYITQRSHICGQGRLSSGIVSTSPQAYSVVTVGDIIKGGERIKVQGYGTNPSSPDYERGNYLIA
ncbi:MAG: metallophosphoesterase [Deltaproteobacteria bacterium]|nr:metallophosphoesterase [Deltaproteobacteria bacterium]